MANTFTKARPKESRYYYSFTSANFYNTATSGAIFVPLVGYLLEQTSPASSAGEFIGIIAPYDGILVKVMVRSENSIRHTLKCELVTASNDTEVPDTSVGEIENDFSGLGNALADDTPFTYDFTGTLDSGVNTFSKGQVLAVRFEVGGSSFGDAYCMAVWRYDVTT